MNFLSVYRNLYRKVSVLYDQLKLKIIEQATGRPRSLTTIETLTLALYWKTQDVTTKKALWEDFVPACTYKTFVVSLNRFALVTLLILGYIMRLNRLVAHTIKHTDSTDVPVCLNKNAKRHRTMEGFAAWGHSGKGWFYGLKLHMTTDLDDRLLALTNAVLTAGEKRLLDLLAAKSVKVIAPLTYPSHHCVDGFLAMRAMVAAVF